MINNYHPFSLFCYFLSVLIFTMFLQSPVFMLIALLGGVLFYLSLNRYKFDYKSVMSYLVLFLLVAITNPLFSHNGVTKLFYINNNAITLEALLYGANIGLMIISVIYWFKCFNLVLTEEKILFLFGKISPKIALILSTSLRFIPMLKEQSKKIKDSQKVMGLYATDNYLSRLKSNTRAFSAVMTYSLEKAIELGQSMEAKGYGLKGRTYYSNYKMRINDFILLAFTIVFDAIIIIAKINGNLDFSFYPSIKASAVNIQSIIGNIAFLLLCFMPFVLKVKEDLDWKYYKSKI